MPNNLVNASELSRGESTTAPLLLLRLVRDLEVLGDELWTAEQAIGQPVSTYLGLRSRPARSRIRRHRRCPALQRRKQRRHDSN